MSRRILKSTLSLGIMSLVINMALPSNQVKAGFVEVTRISGPDRYSTAAQVALKNWTNSNNVVLVSGEGYADAVSASALAKKLNAPILLTTYEDLNENTSLALTSLGTKNIYVVGGNASISQNIRSKLKSKYKLIELGGKDRYETNIVVANELVSLGVDPHNVIMVGGEGFSDALTVATIASAKEEILLLANNDVNCVKPSINFIKANNSKVTVVGTTNVINDEIYNVVNSSSRIDGGADRFDTNLKVLSAFSGETLNFSKVYIVNASGNGYADALVASAVAGKSRAPLVLIGSEGSSATYNAVNFLKSNLTKDLDLNVIGGTGVVTDFTVDYLEKDLFKA